MEYNLIKNVFQIIKIIWKPAGACLAAAGTLFTVYDPIDKIFAPDNMAILVSRGYEPNEKSLYRAISIGDLASADIICNLEGLKNKIFTPRIFYPTVVQAKSIGSNMAQVWNIYAYKQRYLSENIDLLKSCKAFSIKASCEALYKKAYYLNFYNSNLFASTCSADARKLIEDTTRDEALKNAKRFCSIRSRLSEHDTIIYRQSLQNHEKFFKLALSKPYSIKSFSKYHSTRFIGYWPEFVDNFSDAKTFCEALDK